MPICQISQSQSKIVKLLASSFIVNTQVTFLFIIFRSTSFLSLSHFLWLHISTVSVSIIQSEQIRKTLIKLILPSSTSLSLSLYVCLVYLPVWLCIYLTLSVICHLYLCICLFLSSCMVSVSITLSLSLLLRRT